METKSRGYILGKEPVKDTCWFINEVKKKEKVLSCWLRYSVLAVDRYALGRLINLRGTSLRGDITTFCAVLSIPRCSHGRRLQGVQALANGFVLAAQPLTHCFKKKKKKNGGDMYGTRIFGDIFR
ncbi:hypothetical protein CDAR_482611 [Caerostris darwini]|uniref:Uncharacterized protein n=1 Tax=Caerostris darwini TaxID=1538125 RepID=A0AAV4Q2H8_9ARAC|nr:hypothetical protein CDAR_482611 [Caerostris darwini]